MAINKKYKHAQKGKKFSLVDALIITILIFLPVMVAIDKITFTELVQIVVKLINL